MSKEIILATSAGEPGAAPGIKFQRPQKITDLIAAQIRQKIINGELKEGDKLPAQSQLQIEFGVSRPTLREAFRILEAEHLITTVRGAKGGAYINSPDPDLIRAYTILVWRSQNTTTDDIFALRELIEPPIARQLALRTSPDIVDALQACLEEEKLCADDPKRFAKAVTDFHRTLIQKFGNHPLTQLMGTVNDVLENLIPHQITKSLEVTPPQAGALMLQLSFFLRQQLIDRIAAGDAGGAELTWKKYMEASQTNWMSLRGELTVHTLLAG